MQKTTRTTEKRLMFYNYNRLSKVEHLHSRFELILPECGNILAVMDGQEHLIRPGEMLVIFPGVPHALTPVKNCSGTLLAFYREHLSELGESLGEVQPVNPVIPVGGMDPDVRHCLGRLQEMAASGRTDEMLAQVYLTLIFTHLTRALTLEKADPASSKELLYRAMEYISQNLASPLNLKDTAHALGVNNYYLSHVLNDRIHMGFRAYLNTLRIERARRYLRLTTLSVEEVAEACGFNTLRTFDRVFAEHCGCSPRDFRRSHAIVPTLKRPELQQEENA